MNRVIPTVCQACHCECGVLAVVSESRVVGIRGDRNHPMNRGFICVKAQAEPERLYHPDRILHPLKRVGTRGQGQWQRVEWDEALEGIAAGLTRVRDEHGPQAIAAIHGTGPRRSLCCSLLPYALGSANRISIDLHICFAPSLAMEGVTYGDSIALETGPDVLHSKCIAVWGANPLDSHPPRGRAVLEGVAKNGATLIVVDPRRTKLASKADVWLQLRPGTDDALALGLMNVIIEEELYDRDFVEKWCNGFEELRTHVAQFPPHRVARITGVPQEQIEEAARLYATSGPASMYHRIGIEQNINGGQTERALAILIAITGNIDVKGGNLFPPRLDGYIPMVALAGAGPWLQPDREIRSLRIGAEEYPFAAGPDDVAVLPFVPSAMALDAMTDARPYALRALYCAGANPVMNMQNSRRTWHALRDNLDLFVVTDFFMTPSAELADYVLPAATWLEREECCDLSYFGCISARRKAIEPLGEAWDDLKIIIELMKRIPWADRRIVPWNSTEECNDWMLAGLGLTFADLKRLSYLEAGPTVYRTYENGGFRTATGKVELYSTVLERYGYSPLPDYMEPAASPLSTPDLAKRYPLVLISGGRSIRYMTSEGRQIERLRKLEPEPLAQIHPDDARKLGIHDGEWVWVECPQIPGERIRFKAQLSTVVGTGMVHVPYGWWFPERPGPEHGCFESNPNLVLHADPLPGAIFPGAEARGTLCRVYPCEGGTDLETSS